MDPIWVQQYGNVPAHLKYTSASLYEQLRKSAYRYRYRAAVRSFGRPIRYDALLQKTDAAANALQNLGLAPGDRVCLMLPMCAAFAALFYAINRVGAVSVLVPEDCSAENLQKILEQTDAKALFVSDMRYVHYWYMLEQNHIHNVVCVQVWEEAALPRRAMVRSALLKANGLRSEPPLPMTLSGLTRRNDYECPTPPHHFERDEVAVEIAVPTENEEYRLLQFCNISVTAASMQFAAGIGVGDGEMNALCEVPPCATVGFTAGLHAILLCGYCVVCRPGTAEFADMMRLDAPQIVLGTPSGYYKWLASGHSEREDLSYLKSLFFVCDSPSGFEEGMAEFLAAHGADIRLRRCYSMNETGITVMTPLDPQTEGSLGVPLPDVYVRVCAADGKTPKRTGEVGEICVLAPSRAAGEMATVRDEYGNAWIRTGDLGKMTADGSLWFVGRQKRMTKICGRTVFPEVTERAIASLEGVKEVRLTTLLHTERGAAFKAWICPETMPEDAGRFAAEILRQLRQILPKRQIPTAFAVVREMKYDADGNIDEAALRAEQKSKQSPFTLE